MILRVFKSFQENNEKPDIPPIPHFEAELDPATRPDLPERCQRYTMKQPDLDKADHLFQNGRMDHVWIVDHSLAISIALWCGLCHLAWEKVMGVVYKEIGRHHRLMWSSPELLPALFRTQFFWKCQLFEAYVEKIIEHPMHLQTQCLSLSQGFALYQRANRRRAAAQIEMHIFDVLGLPEQVVYYHEHFDKFVKKWMF